jgi:hypothetical protein
LYRQRFFQNVPKLVEHYHDAAEPVRCNFLIALAYMLQGVPRVVLTMSLPEVSKHVNFWYHYVRTWPHLDYMRFEVLSVVLLKIWVLWDVILCWWADLVYAKI